MFTCVHTCLVYSSPQMYLKKPAMSSKTVSYIVAKRACYNVAVQCAVHSKTHTYKNSRTFRKISPYDTMCAANRTLQIQNICSKYRKLRDEQSLMCFGL